MFSSLFNYPISQKLPIPVSFFIILCNGTDNFARITDSYGVARDIFHNNAAANYHIASNVYSWHHLYACTDPDIISNSYRICIFQALIAALIQITAMNIIIYALAIGSIAAVGETIPWKEISLMHLAYYLLQLELSGICFGISAFLRKGSAGIGLGIAAMMYFLNIIANIADVAEFLKYITPFGYCEGADIVSNGSLDCTLVTIGIVLGISGIIIAYLKYTKKDIH